MDGYRRLRGEDPSAATVGPNPYWHSYTFFDGTSNRKTEVQHDTSGNPANNVTATYAYPAAKTAQPHTLRNVTTVGPASGGLPGGQRLDQYEYDKAGNTTSRKIGGTTQDLKWDAEGHLSKVTEGTKVTEFLYDASGNEVDPAGSGHGHALPRIHRDDVDQGHLDGHRNPLLPGRRRGPQSVEQGELPAR
ncbi:hypothetical protein NKG94_16805 [Micromonospora sp. M12]